MLLARIQVAHPAARILLITSPRTLNQLPTLCREMVAAVERTGGSARLIETTAEAAMGTVKDRVESADTVAGPDVGKEYTIVCAPAILDDARSLLMVPDSDAVVVVARRGRTVREDVERAREQITRAGGSIAGGVLLR